MEFEVNLEENLIDLCHDLVNGHYKHGPYKRFSISDPKPRKIAKATVRDRVVHHLIYKKLSEIYEPCFIYDLYSSRPGKGVHRAVKGLEEFIRRDKSRLVPTKIIKCDIKKFFDSVDHGILIRILEKKIKDERFMDLLKIIIGSFNVHLRFNTGVLNQQDLYKGIPLGNVTSQIFANIYLNELDQFIKHKLKIKYYIRYSDDFIFVTNHADLDKLSLIDRFLKQSLKLELHMRKTLIRKPNQGIDFLGYVVFSDHATLRAKTRKRMIKNILKKEDKSLDAVISYFGLLKWCKSYMIRLSICRITCRNHYGLQTKKTIRSKFFNRQKRY